MGRLQSAFLAFVLCLALASPPWSSAQLLLGRISGSVVDSSGAVVAGAAVEAVSTQTNLTLKADARNNGLFEFANLPIGNYRISVSHPGFQTQVFTSILVEANRTTTVSAQLAVGAVSSTVEVTGTQLRNQTDPTNGYVLDSQLIQRTPLGTGSFTQLAILSPGVNADVLAGSGSNAGLGNQAIWANGQRDTSNTITINGVSANNLFNGKTSSQVSENRFTLNTGQNSVGRGGGGEVQTSTSVYDAIGQALPTPPQETLEEVRVNTSQYDATQGGNSGAQIALITKSGTNQFHGQLYEYFQNNIFNAADFFRNSDTTISAKDKVKALHYNRFGATVGGPVIKDKLFFFAAYQGIRDTDNLKGVSYATVPAALTDDRSPQGLANLATVLNSGRTVTPAQISPVASYLLNAKVGGQQLIPTPTITDPSLSARLGYNALINGPGSSFTQDEGLATIDWNASDKDRLSVRYLGSENPGVNPFAQATVLGFPQSLIAGSQTASIDNTYVLSPALTWEQRVGFIREKAFSTVSQPFGANDAGINLFGGNLFPSLSISQADPLLRNRLTIGPSNNFGNAGVYQNRGSWSSNVNWVLGRHTLYFGFSQDYTQLNIINLNNQVASLQATTFLNFLEGTPLMTTNSYYFTGASNRYYHAWQAGAYAQDNYKVTNNLTLNLGVRYDYNGPFAEKYGRLANFDPARYSYNAATDTITGSGIVIAGNNPTLGTKGENDSTINGNQYGFGPRIGVAWNPEGIKNLTVRAGFGLYYDRGEYFTYLSPGAGRGFSGPFGVTLQLPFVAQVQATGNLSQPFGAAPAAPPNNPNAIGAILPNAAALRTTSAAAAVPTYLFGGYDPRNVLPYTENWSFDLQWEPVRDWLLTAGYVGNHGVHQILPLPFNQPQVATAANPINGQTSSYGFNIAPTMSTAANTPLHTYDGGNTDLRVPYLGYSTNALLYQSVGISNYNALQLSARKRFSQGLQVAASYTWSKSLDEQSGLGLFFNGNDPTNVRSSYGPSSYDRTHVFITSYSYDFPRVTDKRHSLLAYVANDWELSGVVTAQSGQPFQFYDFSGAVAGQYYSNNVSILDPAIGFTPGLTAGQVQLQGTTGVNPNNRYIDANQLSVPKLTPGQNGVPIGDVFETSFSGAGRNIFRAPFQFRWDLAVAKSFALTERFQLRYSAEFFNVLNHPVFDAPNNSTSIYTVAGNGSVTQNSPNSSAGFITKTIGSPRFIQMSLRLQF